MQKERSWHSFMYYSVICLGDG